MIGNVRIGGANYSSYVMKGGIKNLSYEIQDSDGALTYPSVSLELSNITGAFTMDNLSPYLGVIDVSVNGKKLFEGKLAQEGFIKDEDNRTVTLKLIHWSNRIVENLKRIKINDIQGARTRKDCSVYTDSLSQPEQTQQSIIRYFWQIRDMIIECFLQAGSGPTSNYDVTFDSHIYLGGSSTLQDKLPDWTAYELITNICSAFNCLWWFDGNKHLHFIPKSSLLKITQFNTPQSFTPIRGTLKASLSNNPGSLIVQYENADEIDEPSFVDGEYSACTRAQQNNFSTNTKKLPLRIPPGAIVYAQIPAGDTGTVNYILVSPPGITAAANQKLLPAKDIAQYHIVDIMADQEVTFEHPLTGDEEFFNDFFSPYKPIVIPGFQINNRKLFMRRAEIDLENEIVRITAVATRLTV